MYLSLLIPAFNEALRIKPGLEKAIDFLKKQDFSWEIIVINDGSQDNTTTIVSSLAKKEKNLKLISSGKNFGKGHSIRLGVEAASGDFIVFSDADFSVPIKFTPLFLKKLKKVDMVCGSRRIEGSRITKHQNFFRESLGDGFTKLTNFALGLQFSDITCGFKGFGVKTAKKLFGKQYINRWGFDAETLFLVKKYKIKNTEVPVLWKDIEGSKVFLLRDIFNSFFDLIRIRIYDLFGAY